VIRWSKVALVGDAVALVGVGGTDVV